MLPESLDETPGKHVHLAYDKGNQLVQVTVQEQGKHITQRYRYDAFGRRLAKYNDPGSSQTSKGTAEESGTDYFGWDGDRLVHTERLGSGNAKNDTDTPQPEVIHTVYEPGSFTPLVQLRRAAKAEPDLADELIAHMQPGIAQDALRGMFADIGATASKVNAGLGNLGMAADAQDFIREQLKGFEQTVNSQREENAKSVEVRHYLCDHLGTPNALVSDRGQIEWAAILDAWGNVKTEHNPKELYQPIRLPGQHEDENTSLFYNRYRYYSSSIGGYTNQDIIGGAGGVNLWLYTGNPLKWIDPLGLAPQASPNACVVDPITKQDVGRFIVDSRGNIVAEPVGGKTIPYPPSNPASPDTHTVYANGSNAYRLNPQGHANNPTPHGHAHLPGTGLGKKGQGASLDVTGQKVPANSAGAHIALKSLAALDVLRGLFQMNRLKSCKEGGFGQCFCALNNTAMGYDEKTSDEACMGNQMEL